MSIDDWNVYLRSRQIDYIKVLAIHPDGVATVVVEPSGNPSSPTTPMELILRPEVYALFSKLGRMNGILYNDKSIPHSLRITLVPT
jgi:hypothetical protein